MENLEEKLNTVSDLINNEDFIGAQKVLKEILSSEPNNIEAIKNLALCEVNLDNPPEAIKLFKKAIELDNNDATSIFYLGSCLSKIGEKEQAIEKFNQVIKLRPDYIDVYKNLAMLYVECAQLDEAIKTIHKALDNPAIEVDYTLNYILATSYMLKKDNTNAIIYLEKALELNENHLPIMNSLASCYMSVKEYKKAEKLLLEAYKLDDKNALTAFNLGVLYQTTEEYKKALDFFQISYQLEPTTTMLVSLANCALKAGEFAIACNVYKNLLSIYPNNSEYRFSYIEALENMQEYEEALNSVDILLSMDEKNIELTKKKGALLRKTGHCEEAIDVLFELLNRGKIDVELYYNLAYCYVAMNDYDNAKEMFKKCITLEPNNPYAHKDLGVLYLKMNCYEWAVDEMREAIQLEEDVAEFHYSLGISYMMLNNIKEGKDALLRANELEENNPDTLAFLGYAYIYERDYENAHKVLQKALEIEPDNFLAKSHSAKYYFQIKKYDVAKQFLQDIVEKTQDDETMNMLAICYLEEKDYEKAMGIFFKLAHKYPQNHILLTNLAKCEFKCSKKSEAQEHIRQALMIFDDYKEALDLLKEMNNGK